MLPVAAVHFIDMADAISNADPLKPPPGLSMLPLPLPLMQFYAGNMKLISRHPSTTDIKNDADTHASLVTISDVPLPPHLMPRHAGRYFVIDLVTAFRY